MITRRSLLASVGGALVLASCGSSKKDSTKSTATVPEAVDASFAQPFSSLASDDVIELGKAAFTDAPEAVKHAQAQFASATGSTQDSLATAFSADIAAGELVSVGGWLVPSSLAGLAAGLAALQP